MSVTRFEKLKGLLDKEALKSKIAEYDCSYVDSQCIVFSESEGTRKVMIPTDVALEWISALEMGVVNLDMTAREMRNKIARSSDWAPYQHGFETHLFAILHLWSKY